MFGDDVGGKCELEGFGLVRIGARRFETGSRVERQALYFQVMTAKSVQLLQSVGGGYVGCGRVGANRQ
jgi:hypothetical protein